MLHLFCFLFHASSCHGRKLAKLICHAMCKGGGPLWCRGPRQPTVSMAGASLSASTCCIRAQTAQPCTLLTPLYSFATPFTCSLAGAGLLQPELQRWLGRPRHERCTIASYVSGPRSHCGPLVLLPLRAQQWRSPWQHHALTHRTRGTVCTQAV